jgi:hypothetical protein
MQERDLLHDEKSNDKLYVVTPTPMMAWMELFVSDSLKRPDLVVLVPSKSLNSEDRYYYQQYEPNRYRDV